MRQSGLVVAGGIAALLAALVLWWQVASNDNADAHLQTLFEGAFVAAGLDPDEVEPTGYFTDENYRERGCPEVAAAGDRWIGRNSVKRIDGVDHRPQAQAASLSYEAEGWSVVREVADGEATSFRIFVERGVDRLDMYFGDGSLDIAASSGPCNPTSEVPDPPFFAPVDVFPGAG